MSNCPTTETLERFAYDFCDTHELAELRAHTAECVECAKRLELLRADGRAIASAAKQVKVPKIEKPAARLFPWVVRLSAAAALILIVTTVAWPHLPGIAQREAAMTKGAPLPSGTASSAALSYEETRYHAARDPFTKASGQTTPHPMSPPKDVQPRGPMKPPAEVNPEPTPMPKPDPKQPGNFKDYGTNPFVKSTDEKLSTFAMDVDTASYTLMRRMLTEGTMPDPASVRVEEFVNFFRYADAAPVDETFAIHLEAAPSRFGKNLHLLRIAVKAKEIAKKDRLPFTLTLVIDTSGSMGERSKMELVKESLVLLVGELREGDTVSIVKYSDEATVLIESSSDKKKILGVLETLHPENSTNAEAGLRKGYDLAVKHFREKTTNRVLLCSDGVANVGMTGPDGIAEMLTGQRKKGIVLTCLGYGIENYNDTLLEQLADKGDGGYYYIDTIKEAKKILVTKLTGTMQVVAKDAKVQVEFDPAVVAKYRLVGYENRKMVNEDFRNDKKDAGEVGAGHDVVALYEVELVDAKAEDRLVKVSVRYCEPDSKEVVEHTRGLTRGAVKNDFKAATLQFQLTAVVAEFAEILRKSPYAKENSLEGVGADAARLAQALDQPEDVKEFVELVKKAQKLVK